MNPVVPIDLLQQTHQFPGPFTFKALGPNDATFQGAIEAAVRAHLGHDVQLVTSVRPSASGRHGAVSVEAEVQTAEQVLAIFASLREVAGLRMLL